MSHTHPDLSHTPPTLAAVPPIPPNLSSTTAPQSGFEHRTRLAKYPPVTHSRLHVHLLAAASRMQRIACPTPCRHALPLTVKKRHPSNQRSPAVRMATLPTTRPPSTGAPGGSPLRQAAWVNISRTPAVRHRQFAGHTNQQEYTGEQSSSLLLCMFSWLPPRWGLPGWRCWIFLDDGNMSGPYS